MEISNNTRARLYEVAFSLIVNNIKEAVGDEKLDYFLEHFCTTFKLDFTSVGIIKNMYAKKMLPNKRELALYCMFTGAPLNKIPVDYRTLRKYRYEWKLHGAPDLMPHVVNNFLQPVIKDFVDDYLKLMYDDLHYIKQLRKL